MDAEHITIVAVRTFGWLVAFHVMSFPMLWLYRFTILSFRESLK